MIKRNMVLYTRNFNDACYLANTLYRPSIDTKQIFCEETSWWDDGCIYVETYDCKYFIYKK